MGLFDRVLGRTAPKKADLDQLFAIPSAALSLEAAAGFRSTGIGSVAFRPAEGAAFSTTERDIEALLDADGGPPVERSTDSYGFTWLLVRQQTPDVPGLVTDLHAVNSTLEGQGFGPMLLCSLVPFADEQGRRLALVYLYKRGTFYPFAPTGAEQRNSSLELQVRGIIADDLKVEADLSRWFPVWGAPGLGAG